MKTRLLVASLALCPLLWSQAANTEASKEERAIKVIRVHRDVNDIVALAGGGVGGGATVLGSNKLGAVVIKGSPSEVERLTRTVIELDSASPANTGSKDIELVVYLVAGSMNQIDTAPDPGAELLAPVYKQLRSVFPYTHYQLLNTVLMRSGQNSISRTSGVMKQLPSIPNLHAPSTYNIVYGAVTASADAPAGIHVEKFGFNAEIPIATGSTVPYSTASSNAPPPAPNWQPVHITIETNVDLNEGQKVVIGTSNIESSEATLFLVVSARIVQ